MCPTSLPMIVDCLSGPLSLPLSVRVCVPGHASRLLRSPSSAFPSIMPVEVCAFGGKSSLLAAPRSRASFARLRDAMAAITANLVSSAGVCVPLSSSILDCLAGGSVPVGLAGRARDSGPGFAVAWLLSTHGFKSVWSRLWVCAAPWRVQGRARARLRAGLLSTYDLKSVGTSEPSRFRPKSS